MLTQSDFESRMIEECLDELYQASQPPCTLEELKEDKEGYMHHYLSHEDCKYIIDKYVNFYNLEDKFKDHCDILIRDITKGCSKDKWIEGKDGFPGHRGYEEVPPLEDKIGIENVDKVVDFINMRRNFYRFNRKCESFYFTTWNYSPTSNKESVIEYWEKQGKSIEIVDRDPTYNYERYYLGCSEEDIKELINE